MSGLVLAQSKWGPGKAPKMVHDHAEEMALVARIKDGEEAKQRLVEIYWERIRRTAEGYYRPGMHLEMDDLMQEGTLALLQAAVDYEPDSGRSFVEWVSSAIVNGIRRAIFRKERVVRLPDNIELDVARILKRQAKLEEELGRKPTVKELTQAVEAHGEWIHEGEWGRGLFCKSFWLGDDPLTNDLIWIFNWLNVISLEEVDANAVKDSEALTPEDLVEETNRSVVRDMVRRRMERLPEREYRILVLRYGFDCEPLPLEEIGRELGHTRERVRQLEAEALQRLVIDRGLGASLYE